MTAMCLATFTKANLHQYIAQNHDTYLAHQVCIITRKQFCFK